MSGMFVGIGLSLLGCAKEQVKVSHVGAQPDGVISRMGAETQARYLHQRLVDSRSPLEVVSAEVGYQCVPGSPNPALLVCQKLYLVASGQGDSDTRASVIRVDSTGAHLVRRYSHAELDERFLRETDLDAAVAPESIGDSSAPEAMARMMKRLSSVEGGALVPQAEALAAQGLTRLAQCREIYLGRATAPARLAALGILTDSSDRDDLPMPVPSASPSDSSPAPAPSPEPVPSPQPSASPQPEVSPSPVPSASPSPVSEGERYTYLTLCQFESDSGTWTSGMSPKQASIAAVLEESGGRIRFKRAVGAAELSAFLGL